MTVHAAAMKPPTTTHPITASTLPDEVVKSQCQLADVRQAQAQEVVDELHVTTHVLAEGDPDLRFLLSDLVQSRLERGG